MRRAKKVVVVGIAVAIALVFFLAPVMFWTRVGATLPGMAPVYRSLGCQILGVGDIYSPNSFGFRLGCDIREPYASLA